MKKTAIIVLCAAMLALPLARAEQLVIVLPTLAPDVTVAAPANPYIIDMTAYYEDIVEWQFPSLTMEECARVPEVLARYKNGERPAENVLNKVENVTVGVYSLDPEQYQGENVFVLLPVRRMTDGELLELIDGYARLGLTFDAEGLSWRNCMRGGALDSTRVYTSEERERVKTLTDLYKRQGLRPERALTPLPNDDGVGVIGVNADDHAGMTAFSFRPCRRMTDAELLQCIRYEIGDDIPDSALMNRYEAQTRGQLTALLGAPLSIKLISESLSVTSDAAVPSGERAIYTAGFDTVSDGADALSYWAQLDTESGLLYWADVQPVNWEALPDSGLPCDTSDEKWLAIARDTIIALRADGMKTVNVEMTGVNKPAHCGYLVSVCVTMADGSRYDMLILCQTERMFSLNYWQNAAAPERSVP